MHQNPPVLGKIQFFFWGGGTAPSPDPISFGAFGASTVRPIIKFWIRHWLQQRVRWLYYVYTRNLQITCRLL